MSELAERYDRVAAGYERWWAPVLAPSAVALLDRLDATVAAGAHEILDVGVGTGNLTRVALARWPDARITAIDASREMIGAVEALLEDGRPEDADRLRTAVAFADQLPFDAGAFDLAMSSFVLQLVPDRAAVLREVRRVLRPGGRFAYVTWLAHRGVFAPDRVFDTMLDQYGFDEEPEDKRTGDLPSVDRAAAELRRAGFRRVAAEGAMLEHRFTVDGYIGFLTEFDEEQLFADMRRDERRRFLITFRERLMALSEDELTFRVPIVYASGYRPER